MHESISNESSPESLIIEQALKAFIRLAESEAPHAEQVDQARSAFFGSAGVGSIKADAERRFMEWYLFERAGDETGTVGARSLAEKWIEVVGEELAPLLPALLDSRVGVFEVTSVEAGRGVWVRDLSGVGEYPLRETQAATEFEVGDLIVGRLYPIGEGVFIASSAAVCVRNSQLTEALRQDLTAARDMRRGVPRLSQKTVEALFFQNAPPNKQLENSSTTDKSPTDVRPEQVLTDCRAWLLSQGISEGDVEEIFESLQEEPFDPADLAPGGSDILGGILAELAIQTSVQLGEARTRLLAVWTVMHPVQSPSEEAQSAPQNSWDEDAEETSSEKARRALQAFDATRVAGESIEDAFAKLESDLGLEPGSSDDSGETTPDFPGVVGAMVDEFLWERSHSQEQELSAKGLHQFANFAAHIGAFEDVAYNDLLLFTGCWLIERGELQNAAAASQTLLSMEQFCRWAESEHSVALWSAFKDAFQDLSEALPRLVTANKSLDANNTNRRVLLYEIEADLTAKRVDSSDKCYPIPDQLRAHLREGDLIRASRDGNRLTVVGCYPGLVRNILQPKS